VFKVNNSVKTAIRKKLQEELGKIAAKTNFESLLNDMLKKKLQVEFKKSLNKICPVKEVVMRVAKIEERKRAKVLKVVEEEA
jgi:ribosomal protein S3AE